MTVTTQGFLGFDEDEIERLAAKVHILAEASEFERLHPRGRTGEFVRTLRHVIAVDGPAASGKSTVARALAARMGGTYIDTGAHFRAAGLARTRGIDPAEALRSGRIRADGSSVTLDGEDVSDAIRTAAVDRAAADLGGVQEVRDAVQHAVLRRLDEGGLFVADGRDAGNALQAEDRIYLTATPEVRSQRRAAARGLSVPEAHAAITDRDAKDAPRLDSSRAGANHVIDNSGDTEEETIQRLVDAVSPSLASIGTSDFFDRQAEGEKAARIRPEFQQMALKRRWERGEFETYRSGMGMLPRVTEPGGGYYGALEYMAKERTGHDSVEDYEKSIQSTLDYLLRPSSSHVAVRVNARSMGAILDSNQLVNIHHPDQSRKMGEDLEHHRQHRAEWEQKVWSIDPTHPEDFPIYGYLAGPNEKVAKGMASGFGDTKLRLREHVRDRSTFTYSDSNYIGVAEGAAIPQPVNRPSPLAVAYNHDLTGVEALTTQHGVGPEPEPPPSPALQRELKRIERNEADWRAHGEEPPKVLRQNWEARYQAWVRDQEDAGLWRRWKHGDFFEAQIFGGVRIDQDVELVTFTSDPDPEVTRKLDMLGIPWGVEGVQEAVFDRLRHPRGRAGEFIETPDPVRGVTAHEFVSALEGFNHGGLRLKARTQRSYPPAGGEARFDVLTEGGEAVGNAGYTWQGHTVHFDRLRVQPTLQGSGFGGALMVHKLDAWRKMGFEQVEVEAIDVGSYGWAKWGFEFQRNPRGEVERIARDALLSGRWNEMREHVGDDVLSALAEAVGSGEFQSPADIAFWGREHTWEQNGQTFWPGKGLLVGGRWKGVLPLA
jgi:cytidylate kinase